MVAASKSQGQAGIELMRVVFAEFVDFADALWKAVGLKPLTARQREIANEMQHGSDRQFIACFRGIGKSYLGAAYALWRGFHDPTEIILILSGSPDKATEISDFMRRLVAHPSLPWLHFLSPGDGQRKAVGAWDFGATDIKQSASVTIACVGAAIQGKRATVVILDDCEQKNNSESETKRVSLMSRMMDTSNMLIPDRPSKSIALGTYQSLNSIYKRLVAERGYSAFVIPARIPDNPDDYDGHLSPDLAKLCEDPANHGKPSDPQRFSHEHLLITEQELGPLDWMIQMMLSTTISDRLAHPFSLADLIVWEGVSHRGSPARILPGRSDKERLEDLPTYGLPGDAFYGPSLVDKSDVIPYLSIIMAIDPAGNSGQDETAYAVLGAVPGKLFLLESGGFLRGTDQRTMRSLAKIAAKHQVKKYVIESNLIAWPTLFQQFAFEIHKAAIEEVRSTKNKVERIAGTLDPVLAGGQLVVAKSVIEGEYAKALRDGYGKDGKGANRARERLLQTQLAMFKVTEKDGGLRHDDRLDALELGVAHLMPFLLSDAKRKLAEQGRARENASWDEWENDIYGYGKQRNSGPTFAQPRQRLRSRGRRSRRRQ